MSVLRDYIAYAKEMIHPRLTPLASQRLIEAYVQMRQAGAITGVISAFPRQLESLIRLSEAHAKIRLSQQVEVVDVEEAGILVFLSILIIIDTIVTKASEYTFFSRQFESTVKP